MPRNDGPTRKAELLHAAETLFSKKGFQGASIAEIAKAAGVNKALVYYYFKSKDDIVVALFRSIVAELEAHAGADGPEKSLDREIAFLAGKRRILAVMLMEALKESNPDETLFRCAEAVIPIDRRPARRGQEDQEMLVSEFFFGFLPLIGFATLQEKWRAYFRIDARSASRHFQQAFARFHTDRVG